MKPLKTHTEKVIRNVCLEGSGGVHASENNVEMEITVSLTKPDYGCFEIYDTKSGGEDWYAEGGLWFEGNELSDYDGVASLDEAVIKVLREWGFVVSEDFEI